MPDKAEFILPGAARHITHGEGRISDAPSRIANIAITH